MNLCVAYPNVTESNQQKIDAFRRQYDQLYVDVIAPHWTMVFPSSCDGFSEDQLSAHIQKIAQSAKPIHFVCNYALVYDDDSSDNYYIFLVPDEGFSAISRLHDALYSDFLRPQLRLDIPFVPHIGIATHKDKDYLYELAQQWNAQNHQIQGSIDSLSLCSYDGNLVKDIATFPLGDGASL